eukprot:UN10082
MFKIQWFSLYGNLYYWDIVRAFLYRNPVQLFFYWNRFLFVYFFEWGAKASYQQNKKAYSFIYEKVKKRTIVTVQKKL